MRGRLGLAAALAVAGSLAMTGAAQADTFEVTRTSDPVPGNCKRNDCSLREAILKANETPGADVVVLPNRRRAYRLAQAGTAEDGGLTGDLDVNNDPLRLRHPGRGTATIDGNQLDRVLHVQQGAPLTLQRITVTGGEAGTDDGGGILTDANLKLLRSVLRDNDGDDGAGADLDEVATLVMKRSKVIGNRADDLGGGINTAPGPKTLIMSSRIANNEAADDEGGGLDLTGEDSARIINSVIVGNSSADDGGGIDANADLVVIRRSTIAGNRADLDGGGIVATDSGTIRIQSSTISGNRADDAGGGLYVDGPAASAVNSTFEGNRANSFGGGIHAQDGAEISLNAVTVVRNRASADDEGIILVGGGGLYRLSSAGFEVRNSLIGLNTIGADPQRNDCASDTPFDSLGNNLITTEPGGAVCDGFDEPSDLVRANPRIGKLKRNGGPTKTVALRRASAAIGNAHRGSAPNRDQRGSKRDRRPDIGAYERGA